ncbi:cupin domain-containing protein [Polaribacter sp. Z014]|uniref:cupin domain-containing protein n=1 Tax=Polaribacter sp. Z014 TaxID=2927126 RepID=UPI002021B911|nr:cupin domain-containing protein [Polaribacter sp. Z014]MCL7764157.1 cupin domain-containing protein [Polaribacter sp. Z014]
MKLVHTNTLPEIGTSHDEDVKKKVFIEKGIVPQLMMFGSATFTPGQSVETHKHNTMYEVFYIQSGKAEFIVNDQKMIVVPGDCITIEQGEFHSMSNPFSENVTWLYFGIATDK